VDECKPLVAGGKLYMLVSLNSTNGPWAGADPPPLFSST